jgi:hypothetical protein
MGGWYVGANTAKLACIAVVGFGIEASIGQRRVEADLGKGGIEQGHKAIHIDAWAPADQRGDHEMSRAVEGCFEFGIAAVSDTLPLLCDGVAAANIVGAAVAAFQAGRIEGGSFDAAAATQKALNGGGEKLLGNGSPEQALARLLQRREMGNAIQVEYALEIAIVLKMLGQTAVVGFEEGFEGKASKELRLRVDMGAEPTGIRTEHQRSRSQRLSGNTQRGFTQRAHD